MGFFENLPKSFLFALSYIFFIWIFFFCYATYRACIPVRRLDFEIQKKKIAPFYSSFFFLAIRLLFQATSLS
jgi:hypothetical protein